MKDSCNIEVVLREPLDVGALKQRAESLFEGLKGKTTEQAKKYFDCLLEQDMYNTLLEAKWGVTYPGETKPRVHAKAKEFKIGPPLPGEVNIEQLQAMARIEEFKIGPSLPGKIDLECIHTFEVEEARRVQSCDLATEGASSYAASQVWGVREGNSYLLGQSKEERTEMKMFEILKKVQENLKWTKEDIKQSGRDSVTIEELVTRLGTIYVGLHTDDPSKWENTEARGLGYERVPLSENVNCVTFPQARENWSHGSVFTHLGFWTSETKTLEEHYIGKYELREPDPIFAGETVMVVELGKVSIRQAVEYPEKKEHPEYVSIQDDRIGYCGGQHERKAEKDRCSKKCRHIRRTNECMVLRTVEDSGQLVDCPGDCPGYFVDLGKVAQAVKKRFYERYTDTREHEGQVRNPIDGEWRWL
jgi:phage terminase large subunit-like protein